MTDEPAPDTVTHRRRGGAGLFLARDRYRQRRLRDVARMMPVVALIVWLFPLLWTGPGGSTASAGVFLFTAWALLIAVAAIIARRIDTEDKPADDDGTKG